MDENKQINERVVIAYKYNLFRSAILFFFIVGSILLNKAMYIFKRPDCLFISYELSNEPIFINMILNENTFFVDVPILSIFLMVTILFLIKISKVFFETFSY